MSTIISDAPHWFFFACLAVGLAGYALVGLLHLHGRRVQTRAGARERGLVSAHQDRSARGITRPDPKVPARALATVSGAMTRTEVRS